MKFRFNQIDHKLMIDDINSDNWVIKHFPNKEEENINVELGEFIYVTESNTLYITPSKNNIYDILQITLNENNDLIVDSEYQSWKLTVDQRELYNLKDLVIKDYNQFFIDYPNVNIELLYVYITGIDKFYNEHWESNRERLYNEYDTILEWDITKTTYSQKVIESYSLIDNIKELKI